MPKIQQIGPWADEIVACYHTGKLLRIPSKVCGDLAVFKSLITDDPREIGTYHLRHVPSGNAVVCWVSEDLALRVGEYLGDNYSLQLREHSTRENLLEHLPYWIPIWLKLISDTGEWVDPEELIPVGANDGVQAGGDEQDGA